MVFLRLRAFRFSGDSAFRFLGFEVWRCFGQFSGDLHLNHKLKEKNSRGSEDSPAWNQKSTGETDAAVSRDAEHLGREVVGGFPFKVSTLVALHLWAGVRANKDWGAAVMILFARVNC